MAGDRRNLAKALVALFELPPALQALAERTSKKGAGWKHLTQPYFVSWFVHSLTQEEPWWKLCLSKGENVEEVNATLYNTLVVKLFIAEVDGLLSNVEAGARHRCLQAVCIHYNSRCSECMWLEDSGGEHQPPH